MTEVGRLLLKRGNFKKYAEADRKNTVPEKKESLKKETFDNDSEFRNESSEAVNGESGEALVEDAADNEAPVSAEGQGFDEEKDENRSASEDELESENEALKEELRAASDRYLRLAAEYDNFRKRSRQEKDELYEKAVCDVSCAWLPVIDNLERAEAALAEIDHEQSRKALEGVLMILKQAEDIFSRLGIEEIPALGEQFDPALHDAVLHIDDKNKKSGEVAEVFQKGYRLKDRILRHSTVKVAN